MIDSGAIHSQLTCIRYEFIAGGPASGTAICLSESEDLINWHIGLLPLLRLGVAVGMAVCPYPCVSILLVERQRGLTFQDPDSPFRAAVIASSQGGAVRSMTLARFLRLFSCYGGSLSSSTSGADRSLPGAFPSFRQVPDGV